MKAVHKFIKNLEKLGKNIVNLNFYATNYDYEIKINGKTLGAVLENRCYIILTDSLKSILPNAKPFDKLRQPAYQYVEYEALADSELFSKCLKAVYNDLYYKDELITDIFGIYASYKHYPDMISKFYDRDVLFLKFCFEKGLLLRNPIDDKDRIIQSKFVRSDFTKLGDDVFPTLYHKMLVYGDRTQNPNYEKMLSKWYKELTE